MRIRADWLSSTTSQTIMGLLTDAGHQAYFVGGCVRNALLDAHVTDLDIATDALPERVIALAKATNIKAIPTGIEHGTVTLVLDNEPFEVTTFRKDVETDGRHAVVAFSDSIEQDARRRDFTMNALYANTDGLVVDPLSGLKDLLTRQVIFIEDPKKRIAEDYLRILRFFRFHAWYGDDANGLDANGLAAIASAVSGLDGISKERIGIEIKKLLSAVDPSMALAGMHSTNVLTHLLSGSDPRSIAPIVAFEQRLGIAPYWPARLASLGSTDWSEDLRLSKNESRQIRDIRRALDAGMRISETAYRFGQNAAISANLILAAALENPPSNSLVENAQRGADATFPLTGSDMADSYSGPALGQALREAEDRWIASEFTLNKADLLS